MRQGQQHKNYSDAYSADTKYSQERYNAEGYRTANILLFLRTMKRKEEVTKQVFKHHQCYHQSDVSCNG